MIFSNIKDQIKNFLIVFLFGLLVSAALVHNNTKGELSSAIKTVTELRNTNERNRILINEMRLENQNLVELASKIAIANNELDAAFSESERKVIALAAQKKCAVIPASSPHAMDDEVEKQNIKSVLDAATEAACIVNGCDK